MPSTAQIGVPALAVRGLRYAYPLAKDRALDGIDLQVAVGEWLALMGANASGKTTLCRALVSLVPHLTGGRFQGQVSIDGRDSRQHPPATLLGLAGLTFQDPESQLFNASVEAEVIWGLEALGLPREEMAERLAWALAAVGLQDLRQRSPERLSGGQQRRLALAAVLAMRPSILVLDSPLSGLDPQGRGEVLDTLHFLRRAGGITVVMAESDAEAVALFADRVAVLAGGRIVAQESPARLFADPGALAAWGVAAPQLAILAADLNRRLGTAYDFLTEADACAALAPRAAAAGRPPATVPAPGPARIPAISCTHLRFAYEPGEPVLQGIDLSIPAGQFVALVGANGSGKTTLARQLIGLLRPQSGDLAINGQDSRPLHVGDLARQVGFLFQNAERQIFSATVRDEIAFGPRNLGLGPAEVDERVAQAVSRFDLAAVAGQPPALLSYAQRRRVTLAAVAALQTPILVLDEPTVGLDATAAATLVAWLQEKHRQGTTILLVTHDLALVAGVAQRVIVLHEGRVAADGAPGDILAQDAVLAEAGLQAPPLLRVARRLGFSALTPAALADALSHEEPAHAL